jgi:hypothetical protein
MAAVLAPRSLLALIAFTLATTGCSGSSRPVSEAGDAEPADANASDAATEDAPSTDSTVPAVADAALTDALSTSEPSVDAGAYCAAELAFFAQCAPDASQACAAAFPSACHSLAANLSESLKAAAVSCEGHFDCPHDVFDAQGCVDTALTGAFLTSLQQSMLTDLCTTCNTPPGTCLNHAELNGPHRFGAGVVNVSDAVLTATGQTCIAQGAAETQPLNCENAAYNCLMNAALAPAPASCQ